jgi:hypothetical protein
MSILSANNSSVARLPRRDDVAEHLRRLRGRTMLLPPHDKVLLELVSTGEKSLRQVARLLDRDAGHLSRRFRLLWHRLHDDTVTLLSDHAPNLPARTRSIGLDRHLLGLTVSQIAAKHHLTPAEVRQILAFIQGYRQHAQPHCRPTSLT